MSARFSELVEVEFSFVAEQDKKAVRSHITKTYILND